MLKEKLYFIIDYIVNLLKQNIFISIGLGIVLSIIIFKMRETFELSKYDKMHIGDYYESYMKPQLYYFYRNDCSFCSKFKPKWDKLKEWIKDSLPDCVMIEVNGNDESSKEKIKEFYDKKLLKGYPSIIFARDDQYYSLLGDMDFPSLKKWVLLRYNMQNMP